MSDIETRLKKIRDDHVKKMSDLGLDKDVIIKIEDMYEKYYAPTVLSTLCDMFFENIADLYRENEDKELASLVIENFIRDLREMMDDR